MAIRLQDYSSIYEKSNYFCIFVLDKRQKRSFSVKTELHDLEKLKLYKDHYYPSDDEIIRLDESQNLGW